MSKDKIKQVTRREFITHLLKGKTVYAKPIKGRKKQILKMTDDDWLFRWSEDTKTTKGNFTPNMIGLIVRTQVLGWCIARENEGCSFFIEQ